MMKSKILLTIILSCCFIFTSCWDAKYYENIGFILTAAMEYKDDTLCCTYVLPALDAQNKGKDEVEILKVDNIKSIRDGRQQSRRNNQKVTEAGKIQQFLFSKELAERGIGNSLQVFERDVANSTQAYVVVVDGSPRELFEKLYQMPTKSRMSFYINEILKNNIDDTVIPETRVYRIGIDKFAEYIDFMCPIIKLSENGVTVTGTALFSKNKMTGTISTRDSLLLLSMMNKFKSGEYFLDTIPGEPDMQQPNHGLVFKIRKSKSKIKIFIEDSKPAVDISLKIDCVLDEKSLNDPLDKELQSKIESYISRELESQCMKVLAYTKEVDSDPIGIGNLFRAKYNDQFKKDPWSCKKIKYNVKVDANLRNAGLFR